MEIYRRGWLLRVGVERGRILVLVEEREEGQLAVMRVSMWGLQQHLRQPLRVNFPLVHALRTLFPLASRSSWSICMVPDRGQLGTILRRQWLRAGMYEPTWPSLPAKYCMFPSEASEDTILAKAALPPVAGMAEAPSPEAITVVLAEEVRRISARKVAHFSVIG